jgi:hypothetical protein
MNYNYSTELDIERLFDHILNTNLLFISNSRCSLIFHLFNYLLFSHAIKWSSFVYICIIQERGEEEIDDDDFAGS